MTFLKYFDRLKQMYGNDSKERILLSMNGLNQ